MTKAQSRRSQKLKNHYANQFIKTSQNKQRGAARVARRLRTQPKQNGRAGISHGERIIRRNVRASRRQAAQRHAREAQPLSAIVKITHIKP
jgi:hypothetical protein